MPDKVFSSSNKFKIKKYNNYENKEPSSIIYPVFGFCGIGDPDSFLMELESLGFKLDHFKKFKDHESYSHRTLKHLLNNIKKLNINSVLSTEKEAI